MKFELSGDHSVTLRSVTFKLTEEVSVSGFTATHVRISYRDDAISEFLVQGAFPNGDFTFRHMPLHDVFGTEWQTFIDNVPAKETAPSS